MAEILNGQWVRRQTSKNKARFKWHLVESTIAGDAVTKCGRRMDRTTAAGSLETSDVEPLTRMIGQPQLCRQCS